MKTYKQWQGSGVDMGRFFCEGDVVDQEMYDYLLEVVFPVSFGAHHVQCGEAADHNGPNARARYTTIARAHARAPWVYLGERVRGDVEVRL